MIPFLLSEFMMMPIFESRLDYSQFSRPFNLHIDAVCDAIRHCKDATVSRLPIYYYGLEYLLHPSKTDFSHICLHMSSLNSFGGALLEQPNYQMMFSLRFSV